MDRFLDFIRDSCKNKRTFVICSGDLGKQVIPKIHDLPQVYGVYINCYYMMYQRQSASEYYKVRMICDDDFKFLIPQLAVDLLKKRGDKATSRKKLELALNNVTHYMKNNPQPDLEKEIRRNLEECY